jgi:predicted transposase YdaD
MSAAEMLKEEGRAEGRQEGRAEGRQVLCDSVLDLLETRFQVIPARVREAVLRVEDLSQLRNLVRRAAVCASLDEFSTDL